MTQYSRKAPVSSGLRDERWGQGDESRGTRDEGREMRAAGGDGACVPVECWLLGRHCPGTWCHPFHIKYVGLKICSSSHSGWVTVWCWIRTEPLLIGFAAELQFVSSVLSSKNYAAASSARSWSTVTKEPRASLPVSLNKLLLGQNENRPCYDTLSFRQCLLLLAQPLLCLAS